LPATVCSISRRRSKTEYQLGEVGIDPDVRARITQADYPSGHMIYLNDDALHALRADLGRFYATAVTGR
jgi:hypothetical protein